MVEEDRYCIDVLTQVSAVVLDMTNPNDLRLVGRTQYPLGSDGDTHSAVPNAAGKLLVTTDEDFGPADFNAAGEPRPTPFTQSTAPRSRGTRST